MSDYTGESVAANVVTRKDGTYSAISLAVNYDPDVAQLSRQWSTVANRTSKLRVIICQ